MDMSLPSPAVLLAGLIFGVIGAAAFMYGKKQARFSSMAIGVALIAYPYFVSAAWLLWTIGIGLCAALYYFRDW
jgi:hypothetical protein